jgi:2-polyprenyl-3-methyl-5-hydroxy-6-metoxy-1,4-benzoquinol methylase
MNPYLLRKLEESSGYAYSFSNRYMNWKRRFSIQEAVEGYLKRLPPQGDVIRILDAGCGDGRLIYFLKTEFDKKYRLEFAGVDISELDIDFANQRKAYFSHLGCDFQVMDINRPDLPDESFDVIICTEVIEHIADPPLLMSAFRKILKKNGLLIVTTPNKKRSFLSRIERLLKRILRISDDVIHDKEKDMARLSSSSGKTGSGEGHISVKEICAWKQIFTRAGFQIRSVRGTAGLMFGSDAVDRHRILVAVAIILDTLSERLPGSCAWSEVISFELKKS